jgi:hypothetical protein
VQGENGNRYIFGGLCLGARGRCLNFDALLSQIAELPLSEIETAIASLPEGAKKELTATLVGQKKDRVWTPNPGPQTEAYFHPADVLLYGGQGGGGKTDLGLGLAFTAHSNSLVMRRKYTDLGGIIERAEQINGGSKGFNKSPPPKLRLGDGKLIEFGAAQHKGDEQSWQGRPHDLLYLDEATQFLESQVRFLLGWLRSTKEGQRVRAVLGTNPPVDAEGDWIVKLFRPWLDITHPNPAQHGELRWFVTAPDGADLEVDGSDPVILPGADKPLIPMSRSFIPAALADNPFLIDTGYQAKLDGLPEPLRSAVRDGNFMAARSDAEYQVIPTQWVIEAQNRWKPDGWKDAAMTACAIDIGAGRDETVLTLRHGGWFAEQKTIKGEEGKDPAHAAGLAVRWRKDGCPVVIDVGGGFGGPAMLMFKENGIDYATFNGAGKAAGKSIDGQLAFINKRAEAWWRMREALDPGQEGGSPVALPPDPQLRADLTAPIWMLRTNGVQIEGKDDIKKRIGRSPDRGDSAVMCLAEGARAAVRRMARGAFGGQRPKVIMKQRGR